MSNFVEFVLTLSIAINVFYLYTTTRGKDFWLDHWAEEDSTSIYDILNSEAFQMSIPLTNVDQVQAAIDVLLNLQKELEETGENQYADILLLEIRKEWHE